MPTTAYYVEFPNDDVGPFQTSVDAEAYRRYEGNLDETQVFRTEKKDGYDWLDLATVCPDAIHTRVPFEFDRYEHGTLLAAVIHYAGVVYDPSECIRVLTTLCPDPKQPWDETIAQYRTDILALEQGRKEAAIDAEP